MNIFSRFLKQSDTAPDHESVLRGLASLLAGAMGLPTPSVDQRHRHIMAMLFTTPRDAKVERVVLSLLEKFEQIQSVPIIFVEGAEGEINTELFRIGSLDIRKQVMEQLLSKGQVTGVEMFAVIASKAPILLGISSSSQHSEAAEFAMKVQQAGPLSASCTAALRQIASAWSISPRLLSSLCRLELLPEDFAALQNAVPGSGKFDARFADALTSSGCSEADRRVLLECGTNAWAFYCNAIMRSADMAQRILARLSTEQFIWGVTVTTGFHQKALSDAMKKANVLTLEKTMLPGW